MTGKATTTVQSSSARRLLLAATLAAAVTLRLWYGWQWPDRSRFWDEGYALENVRSVLVDETLRPAKAYYPSPVFNLPPALVIRALEGQGEQRLFDPATGGFGAWAYRICRAFQALAGGLGLLMLYFLGNRLFGPREGLLASAILAFVPWHVHASGIFKPDALLSFGVLAALAAAAWFFERPGWKQALAVGAGVALAASAKLTGALVAVPLAASALWLWRRRVRHWLMLVVAGASSALLFILVNPYWRAYPHFVSGLQRDYAMRAHQQGMTRWQVPERFLRLLTGSTGLGLVAGTAAVVAYVWLVARLLRAGGTRGPAHRAGMAAVLAFPPLYATVYALQTAYFKANNFLPLIPVFALALAAGAVALGRQTRRPAAALALSLVAFGPVAWLGWTYTYRSLVPSTRDAALRFAASWVQPGGRLVAFEAVPPASPSWEAAVRGRVRAAAVNVARGERTPESLDRFDAVVLRAPAEARHADAVRRPAEQVAAFTPHPFTLRGPAVTVVRHPWRLAETSSLATFPCGRAVCARVPRVTGSRWISLSVWLGWGPGESRSIPVLEVAGEVVPLHPVERSHRGLLLASERFPVSADGAGIRLLRSEGRPSDRFRLLRWRRPRQVRPAAQPS